MKTHWLRNTVNLLMVPVLVGLMGCENNNLFSKLHGDSSDPATLNAQASIALRDKNFGKALELANRVLATDPNNSEALYYASTAQIGTTGLSFTTLVSNVLKQKVGSSSFSSSSVEGLGDFVAQSRISVQSIGGVCGGTNSLLAGVNCDLLNSVIDLVIYRLRKIASGSAQGLISRDDIPMLLDYGILSVLRAALLAIRNGYLEFNNESGDFVIQAGPNLNTLCTSNQADAIRIVNDVAVGYAILNHIISLVGLSDNSIILRVRNDIKDAGDQIFTEGGGSQILPQACFDNVFDLYSPPLTKSNYLSVFNDLAFTPPS